MKKIGIIVGIVIFFFFVPSVRIYAEDIASFDTAIAIEQKGTIVVSEKILYDFGSLQKHGIFRKIPLTKKNAEGKTFNLTFSDFQVTDGAGTPYRFSQASENGTIVLKIGDPDVLVTGQKEYAISYVVSGALTYFSDHDELYWQVTGTEWQVPIRSASALVSLPLSLDSAQVRSACYTGIASSTASDCTAHYQEGTATISSLTEILPGSGLTAVVGFPKNIVAVLEPTPVNTWFSDALGVLIAWAFGLGAILWYLILPVWIVIHWFRSGRDPKPPMGVAKAWFDVPKTDTRRPLTPAETGTLIDERADMREITATIVDLARRGYLKIVETKKGDFTLEKRTGQGAGDSLEPFESGLYKEIFSEEDNVRIKDAELVSAVAKAKKDLYEAVVREKFFVSNPDSVRTKYMVLGVLGFFSMNFPLVLSAFIFGLSMPRKTIAGAQAAAIANALKNFITSQDRQYAYQAKNQIFFEKFLPYAVAFGVEKIWAERCKNLGIQKPDWYEGYNMRTFNSVLLVNALDNSMHSFTSAATPTSSSSGFSSGFSGGSVGGGGGGGGGGSW